MYKRLPLYESVEQTFTELSPQTIRVQQGLSQSITDLDTRLGSIANKASDPVLRTGIEDLKLRVQGIIGDFSRAVPLYEKNKVAMLAASIDTAGKSEVAQDGTQSIQQPENNKIQPQVVPDATLTESVSGNVQKFIMEGWLLSKPEMSHNIEAEPADTVKLSRLFSILPKSASGCSNVKILISMVDPKVTATYDSQLGDEERELSEKESNIVFWKGAIEDIKKEIIKRLKNASR